MVICLKSNTNIDCVIYCVSLCYCAICFVKIVSSCAAHMPT